jgi:hypothetical protein
MHTGNIQAGILGGIILKSSIAHPGYKIVIYNFNNMIEKRRYSCGAALGGLPKPKSFYAVREHPTIYTQRIGGGRGLSPNTNSI